MPSEPAPHLRSVIITGGASGIGFEIAKFYAADQSNCVYIIDLNAESGVNASKTILNNLPGSNVQFKQCDIASWDSLERVFREVFLEQGNVYIVVANAGISERGHFIAREEAKPTKPNLATLDVNLIGTIYTVKLAAFYIRKSCLPSNEAHFKGSILCIASVAGIYPFPTAPVYAATKHAIVGLVRSLARPLALDGISINALAPNVIETKIAASAELFKRMILTPSATLREGMKQLSDHKGLTGKVLVLSGDKVTYQDGPAFDAIDEIENNIEEFWRLGYS
ncbi:hypothetical protein BJX66DRAFT_335169 [Aspergillus keveii]|uniref:Short chain dehydrogenase/reductase n=1 Tax=Aspergillus keveii TaxID=714993 RepID=A0ABR4GE97_9EURO